MKKTTSFIVLILVCVTFIESCSRKPIRSTNYSYQNPLTVNDGIITGELTAVGIDTNTIITLTKLILADSIQNVHSLLILKDGKLVYENYFAGKDQKHGKKLGYIEHSMDQLHDCRSVSKSVTAACIGIAIQKGMISSVNDPINKYLTEIQDSAKGAITLKNLLTMTSGLEWNEIGSYGNFFNNETQMDIRFNPVKYILRKPIVSQPGLKWNYSAGNTQLLAEIIYRSSGLTVDKFAEQYLFHPLGIKNYEWVKLLFKKLPAAASGLRLSSRDLLKLGLLYLNDGKYGKNQVVDRRWVNESLKPFIHRPELLGLKIKEGGYGYMFWTYTDTVNGKQVKIVEAKGNGGQSILICKSLNLMAVTTGGNFNKADDNPYRMLTKYIIPSIASKDITIK
jgi:CubicO group peptidase (beta-lactamase class C family)